MEIKSLSYEVCRRNGACLRLYGSTLMQIDEWTDSKLAEGSQVAAYTNCEGLCDLANNSSTSLDGGVTGIRVTGTLPSGQEVSGMPAIAVSINGLHKSRLIR